MLHCKIQCVVLLLKVTYLAGAAGACAACQRGKYGNPGLISAFYSPCREREEQGELCMKQQD